MKTAGLTLALTYLVLQAGGVHVDAAAVKEGEEPRYRATRSSLEKHPLPEWYSDAKLGIFIHWGLYSVPAWAPVSAGLNQIPMGEFFLQNPYAEWYLNSIRIKGSPSYQHHVETYGEDYDYYDFARRFNEEIKKWNPQEMARLFKKIHARYVVLTTKHHDGFVLWPTQVRNSYLPFNKQQASRDLVGELTEAVRAEGMTTGLYYSGGLDWSFHPFVITGSGLSGYATPPGEKYARYADAQWRELIERYEPLILWNDINYPSQAEPLQLFADYYNKFADGVLNDRWGVGVSDYTTPEYARYEEITPKKWESCRGIDFSFGYNQNSTPLQMLSVDELVDSFVDIVSKNGNLLLNVGPKADGSIPELQLQRLLGLGEWLDSNGEAIFETRPWIEAEGRLEGEGTDVRFTQKGDVIYVILLDEPKKRSVMISGLKARRNTTISLLGNPGRLDWESQEMGILVTLPESMKQSAAYTLKISPQPWRLMEKSFDGKKGSDR